ncbi:hypothetical protein Q31b_55590 [Novipirellula aureliae]|uniref:Glycoside-hydrolase family GH114 TIM-barrel domain-containing protein n=1 Tax=Novipirellula aureliae TaxID=2527966 RepID=A0A5C6DF98_9BACT|nr:putative glycoside hydrolase [Novipirellula aureliae]TWU34604.1 hypothetical protein Q31b_55590 [Novipirellula aureliae]
MRTLRTTVNFIVLLLTVNATTPIQAQPGYAGEWKKTRLYGHTSASSGFTQKQYEFIRDHHEIFCFEKTHLNRRYGNPSHEKSSMDEAAHLKSLNPRCKPITIYSIRRAYPAWNESTKEALAVHPEWATKIGNGKYDWDLNNSARNDWYVETMNTLVDSSELEGVFIDGLEGVYSRNGEQAKSIMERMHGLSLMNGFNPKGETSFKTGPDFLEHCAGVFVDSWFRRELDTKDAAQMMIDTCMTVPNDKVMILFSANDNDGIWGTDHTFSHAAYLIVAHENTYYRWAGNGLWGADVLMEYHEDFDKEMGKPLGKAVKDGYVYTRKFEHCFVTLDLEKVTSSIAWGQNNDDVSPKGKASQSSTDFPQ